MRMIPDQVSPATKSNAEKELFRRLKLVEGTDWSFALHSLNLAEHVWKRVGEIDFLVVGPRGIYVLEVKGGGVSCERGIWRFTDRAGYSHRKREGPLARREARCSPCSRGFRNRCREKFCHGSRSVTASCSQTAILPGER